MPEWRERAASLGLDAGARSRARRAGAGARGRSGDRRSGLRIGSAAPDGLTHRRSTFTRRDVVQALCEQLPAGVDVTVAELERRRRSLPAVGSRGRARRRRAARARRAASAGRPGGADRCRASGVYSTPELLALEQRVLEHASTARTLGRAVARSATIERAIAAAADDRRRAGRRWCGGSRPTATASPWSSARPAPARRSRSPQPARRGRRAATGWSVRRSRGVRRGELEESAGIPSTSVAALLARASEAAVTTLPRRRSLVVDEAGMVPTRAARRAGRSRERRRAAKLVLVGDHRQLAEIEAGGAFRALASAAAGDRAAARTAAGRGVGARRAGAAARRRSPARRLQLYEDARPGRGRARTRTRSGAAWSPTGGRRATPTAR